MTSKGHIVAAVGAPRSARGRALPQYDALVASGDVREPLEDGDPLADWPDIFLPAGTAGSLIDVDRGEMSRRAPSDALA